MKFVLEKDPAVRNPSRNAGRIALTYMTLAVLWLTFSNRLAARWVTDPTVAPMVQWLRGGIFILVTGGLLYLAMRRIYRGQRNLYRHLEHSERAYRAMFEHNPNPMYIYHPETLRILAVNAAAIAKYGFSREEFMTMTLWELRPPEARAAMQQALDRKRQFRDTVTANAVTHWTKDRRLLTMEVTGYSLQFERQDARLVLARDVSDHVQVERELRGELRAQHTALDVGELGTWTMLRDEQTVQLSERMQALLGQPEGRISLSCADFFACFVEADRELLQQACSAAWQGSALQLDVCVAGANGDFVHLQLRAEGGEAAENGRLIGIARDITAVKKTEQRLRANVDQYRQMADLMPEALLIHRDARVIYANVMAAELFGVSHPADMHDVDIRDFIASPSQPDAFERLRSFQEGSGDGLFQERLLRKKNGEVFAASVAAQILYIDGQKSILALVRDINLQKKAQSELETANQRLQRLSERMAQTTENERRDLSRELHDDLGQSLTFIKMTAAWLSKREHDAELGTRIAQIHEAAGDALDKVRNLALALRPAQLDALGLKAAMEEHLHKFFSDSGIHYAIDIDELQPRPQPLVEMAAFRVFQEALTNILRHSGAGFVRVALTRNGAGLKLQVIDDGQGFDVEHMLAQSGGLGLRTMRERAQQVGGDLKLHSVPGFGTELTATFAKSTA